MEEIKLDVQIREGVGTSKAKQVRRMDAIPAIIYGSHKKPTTVQVDRRTFERIERQYQVERVVIHLNLQEKDKKPQDMAAIVKEIQLDPVSDRILHVDFQRISLTEEIEVKVPVVAKGESPVIKQGTGILEHALWELTVSCLPTNIPQQIEVDISALKLHDMIHVKDIALPSGVKVKNDPDAIVFSIVAPMKEEVAAPAAEGAEAATSAEPEVIKEKKKEEAAPGAGGEKGAEKKPQEAADKGK